MEQLTAYPYGVPSNVIEPLDLEDVKSYLSIRADDTSQDAFLQDAIPMCRATLEQHLPWYVITGTVRARCLIKGSGDIVITVKGPIRSVTSATLTAIGEDAESITASIIDEEHIQITVPAHADPIRFDITYTVGSAIDQRVRTILLTMVHNRYDRKYEDPYTEEVRRMAYPLMRINI